MSSGIEIYIHCYRGLLPIILKNLKLTANSFHSDSIVIRPFADKLAINSTKFESIFRSRERPLVKSE